MEKPLIAAAMRSRQDFDLIKGYIDVKLNTYGKEFQVIMGKIHDYYSRDGDTEHVTPEVLMAQIGETLRSEKLVSRLGDMVAESLAENSSDTNVRAVILMAKQQEVGDKLAAVLSRDGAGPNPKVDELIAELQDLRNMTDLADIGPGGIEVETDIDFVALMEKEFDPANIIKVYPSSLNDRLDGGAHRGHHIVVFARPETGKTATVVNMSGGFARQDKRVLYVINEDRITDLRIRVISNLSGMTKHQIRDNPRKALDTATNHGYDNIMLAEAFPGTPGQLAAAVEKYQPDVLIVDQLRNLAMKADNRVNQLEAAATGVRNLGKEANVLAISVTQAGDSASGKLILEQGDVDFSNTGIPAQADLMVGIGVNEQMEAEGLRVINLPKNKIGAVHEHFPVRIHPQYSRIVSV
jgi:archaellum biogenesis ATPase FlaH